MPGGQAGTLRCPAPLPSCRVWASGSPGNELPDLETHHLRLPGPPNPDQTIADFAVNTAHLAGFIPSESQPTPGTGKLREGYLILSLLVEYHRAVRDSASIELTVLH